MYCRILSSWLITSCIAGSIPSELVREARGGEVHVDMEDHRWGVGYALILMWNQCCGSKYIEFGSGSGSRSLAQFGSGSGSRSSAPFGSSVMLSILKEKIKNNFREKLFFLTKSYILRTKMSPLEIFSQLSHWIVNLYLKSHTFCLYFILFIHVWIRIRIPNKDPDPQSSWIRIRFRIHNTVWNWPKQSDQSHHYIRQLGGDAKF